MAWGQSRRPGAVESRTSPTIRHRSGHDTTARTSGTALRWRHDRHREPDSGRSRRARGPPQRRAVRRARRPARPATRATCGPPPRPSRSPAASPARAPSSTASADVVVGDPQRRGARPGHRRARPAPAARPRAPTTSWWSARTQPTPPSGNAILRTVDPNDKLVYVWSTLRARHGPLRLRLLRPARPQGAARLRGRRPRELDGHQQLRPRPSVEDLDDGGRRWTLRRHAAAVDVRHGRQRRARSTSCARSAAATTSACTAGSRSSSSSSATPRSCSTSPTAAWRSSASASASRSRRSATTRCSCPTWAARWRTGAASPGPTACSTAAPRPTASARCAPQILLHEMAHMWFGDLVTMRWWDDLWLNEAFASWAVQLGRRQLHRVHRRVGDLPGRRQAERLPRRTWPRPRHPIRGEVPDVAQAMANFDAITYAKGASVLKQLMAYVGEDAFVEGLRAYFREHAWGNTVLDDLMSAIGEAAGRDLTGWTVAWLDRAGTDTLRADGRRHHRDVARRRRPAAAPARRRLLRRRRRRLSAGRHDVRSRPRAPRTAVDLPDADLHLLNAGDLTFAARAPRRRARSRALLDHAADLPAAVDRALAVVTGFQMLCDGELGRATSCSPASLDVPCRREHSPARGRAVPQRRPGAGPAVDARRTDRCRLQRASPRQRPTLADDPDLHDPGAAHPGGRGVHGRAPRPPRPGRRRRRRPGLAGRHPARRAGRYDEDSVEALLERDPDPDAPCEPWRSGPPGPTRRPRRRPGRAVSRRRTCPGPDDGMP